MKILYVTSSCLGDAILGSGPLNALLQEAPGEACVTIACGARTAPLFEDIPGLEEIIPFSGPRGLHRWWNLWKKCSGTRWDVVVDLRGSALSYLLKTKRRHVWRSNKSKRHCVENIAHVLGFSPTPPPRVWIGKERLAHAKKWVKKAKGPVFGFSPVAGWPLKEWPVERFGQLIKDLLGDYPNAKITLFGSPSEQERLEKLWRLIPQEHHFPVQGSHHLLDTAACLSQCTLFVGNDSGLMHLSSALNVPTVGLFGPSDEKVYAPWGKKGLAIRCIETAQDLMKQSDLGKNLMEGLSLSHVTSDVQEFAKKHVRTQK
ncbi:MAG: glycosyltransferase family 9 protein [bacterium]|nr:glycosyltransferase family 9 protein [bacterium]